MPPQIFSVKTTDFTNRFKKDFKQLPPDIQESVQESVDLLKTNPHSNRIRLEKLRGFKNPSVYTIHATTNHSHKISFELQGTHAIFRRVGTHKEIDRAP